MKLENELNELSTENIKEESKSGLFNSSINLNLKDDDLNETKEINETNEKNENLKVNFSDNTFFKKNNDKTWDGFNKVNNIPINNESSNVPKMSREELLKEKFKYLRKLETLERKGVELTKKYTMESSLDEMQGEYEMIISEKEKGNSIKFQGKMLMAFLTGIEFLNNKFDPFDIKLDGWSEQVNENIDDYDEIFSELHEKYKSKASMAP